MSPSTPSGRLSLGFSCVGHFAIHMFAAFFGVVVVAMARDGTWAMRYDELLPLWTLGAALIGIGAIPAGRLGDLWGAPVMMVLFFIGMGTGGILAGLAQGPTFMMAALAILGLFAAIYHPIGLPWLIRASAGKSTGKLLAVNGLFGSFGTAAAGIVAGGLIDLAGWRVAFIVPGAITVAIGIAMLYCLLRGRVRDDIRPQAVSERHSRGDLVRVFLILVVSMFVGGIIYNTLQTALPKVFAERLGHMLGDGALGVGAVFSAVFVLGGIMQIVGGHLADRYRLKTVYILCWGLQVLILSGIAVATDLGVVGFAALAVMANVASLPAENMMLARYTPAHRHGIAFGAKFVLAFCAGPVAIWLISWTHAATGEFAWLFAGLAAATGAVMLLLLALPSTARTPSALPAE